MSFSTPISFNQMASRIKGWAGRPITAKIRNNNRRYFFERLKPSVSYNPNCCGVSLNHTFQRQMTKRSRFHDEEDVCISFDRAEFQNANLFVDDSGGELITICCEKFYCELRA